LILGLWTLLWYYSQVILDNRGSVCLFLSYSNLNPFISMVVTVGLIATEILLKWEKMIFRHDDRGDNGLKSMLIELNPLFCCTIKQR